MAKKASAASKGYRKNVKKKPFLTKKEIIALIVIIAVIAIVMVLFNLLYNPFVNVADIQPNDIIANANTGAKNKFMRLGTVSDLEGYTRESSVEPDHPTGSHSYTPVDESDPLDHFTVSGSVSSASRTLSYMLSYYSSYDVGTTEIIETEVDGHTAYICGFTMAAYDAEKDAEAAEGETAEPADAEVAEPEATAEPTEADEAAEPEATAEPADAEAPAEEEHEPNSYNQNISMYIVVDDSHSIGVNAYREGDDESFYLPDDEIEAYMLKLAEVVTVAE